MAQQPRPPAVNVLGLIIGVGLGLFIWHIATTGGPGTTFRARVEHYTVINPADLAVVVQVTNTGTRAAKPACTVTAQDASGAYSGFDSGTLTDPVPPGQTVTYVDNLVITGQGAGFVTQADAKC